MVEGSSMCCWGRSLCNLGVPSATVSWNRHLLDPTQSPSQHLAAIGASTVPSVDHVHQKVTKLWEKSHSLDLGRIIFMPDVIILHTHTHRILQVASLRAQLCISTGFHTLSTRWQQTPNDNLQNNVKTLSTSSTNNGNPHKLVPATWNSTI